MNTESTQHVHSYLIQFILSISTIFFTIVDAVTFVTTEANTTKLVYTSRINFILVKINILMRKNKIEKKAN